MIHEQQNEQVFLLEILCEKRWTKGDKKLLQYFGSIEHIFLTVDWQANK